MPKLQPKGAWCRNYSMLSPSLSFNKIHVYFEVWWLVFLLGSFSDEFGRRVRGKYDGPKINDYDKFCKYIS